MPIYTEKIKDKNGNLIDKLVDGKKQYYIRTYVEDEFGNRKQITRHNKEWLGREGYWEAQREENILKNEAVVKKKEHDNITINQSFIELCKEDVFFNRNGESTRLTNTQRYNRYIKDILGNKKVKNLTTDDITNFVGFMKTKSNDIRYINQIIRLLKRIYMFSVEKYSIKCKAKFYTIKKNKDEIVPVTMQELINQEIILSPDEWNLFIDKIKLAIKNCSNKNDKLTLIKLSLLYSCEYILLTRVGETQGMKIKNLVPEANIYVLYEAWNKYLHKMTPLKNRKARLLYVPPKLTSLFIELSTILKSEYGYTDDDFLFPAIDSNRKDIPISRSSIDRYRKEFCTAANIDYVTNHELRHAGISNAVHNEVDVSALSDMAGHSKQVMFATYVQTLKKANSKLIDTLDSINVPILNFK